MTEEVAAEVTSPGPTAGGFYWGTGRRKTSVARVRIREGRGEFKVNGREVKEFFGTEQAVLAVAAPLKATSTEGKYDVFATVDGGGLTGQSGAILLGLSRALIKIDATLEEALRGGGFVTRDSRMKERKKYGQRGARRRFQFSKR
ncbi:MAG: 30S ribosomal protein S9 [Planctomycetota bacterium]